MIQYRGTLERGFTLVELLIVIAIIGILASVSITYYQKYRQKSILASHALPIVNACAKDIITYCIELNPSSPQDIDISSTDLENCKPQRISSYNLEINLTGSFTCYPGGNVGDGVVEARLNEISEYRAICYLEPNALKCKIEGQ